MTLEQCEGLEHGQEIFIRGAYGCSRSSALYFGTKWNTHVIVESRTAKHGLKRRTVPLSRIMRKSDV